MDAKTKARLAARSKILKAIAHPSRLFIVDELSKGERCVCELTEMIGADMSTISKHLSILKSAGLVQDEKRGTQVYYILKMRCIMDFLNCVESAMIKTAEEQLSLMR